MAPAARSATTVSRLFRMSAACSSGLRFAARRTRTNDGVAAPDRARIAPKSVSALTSTRASRWRAIVGSYELSPGEVELLRQACVTVDLLARIDDQLSREDLTVAGSRGQQRAHPLVSASMEQRRVLAGLMSEMALPFPNESEGRKRSLAAVKAAQARLRERRTS